LKRQKLGQIDAEAKKAISENGSIENGENEKKVNGSVDPEVIELRKQIEKQSTDLGTATRTIGDCRSKITELEDKLMSNNKELHSAQDLNQTLQQEFKETMAQKDDQVILVNTNIF